MPGTVPDGTGAPRRPLRVAIANGHGTVRDALREQLERQGLQVTFEAGDGQELLDALQLQRVDVILCSTRMPGVGGLAALRELRAIGDRTPVVLLATPGDGDLSQSASQAGAQALLPTDVEPAILHEAILQVAAAGPFGKHPAPARQPLSKEAPTPDAFDPREVAILRLLAEGGSNQEIARQLDLAEGTVKNCVTAILDKLGTVDRTRAALKAITLRII